MNEQIQQQRPLEKLKTQEAALWHALEKQIKDHAFALAQQPPVAGADKLLDVWEAQRQLARGIAEGIRELTMIIRQEILLEDPLIKTDALAAAVDQKLSEAIQFHFRAQEEWGEIEAAHNQRGVPEVT